MSASLRIAAAATRSWVGVYTAGMPSERRSARRTEIESGLWDIFGRSSSSQSLRDMPGHVAAGRRAHRFATWR